MAHAFICDYVRTPIGRYGGGLAKVRADDLGGWCQTNANSSQFGVD